jgi:hypothetical protein
MTTSSLHDVLAALARISADPCMGAGGRRAALLHHLGHETLADRAARLKGTAIAIDVFGRGEDFNPQTNALVRMEARRLRQALDTYYAGSGVCGSGADDPVRIVVPKSGYVPRFEWRDLAAEAPGIAAANGGVPFAEEPAEPPEPAMPVPGPQVHRSRTDRRDAGSAPAGWRRPRSP